MKTRSIVMRSEEVRAILEGIKSQFRRPVEPQSIFDGKDGIVKRFPHQQGCPFGTVGDRLWVKETFNVFDVVDGEVGYPLSKIPSNAPKSYSCFYRADLDDVNIWRPSVHMPRWASRITLEIVNVHVERVQEISDKDAKAEGVEPWFGRGAPMWKHPYTEKFEQVWNSIYGKGQYAWDNNPWVWVCWVKSWLEERKG